MKSTTVRSQIDMSHPLDNVEDIALTREWTFERHDPNEFFAEIEGRWCLYRLCAFWREEFSSLHLTCAYDIRIPIEKRPAIYELMALINERLWMGYFNHSLEDDSLAFRYTLVLSGGLTPTSEQIHAIMDETLTECDRFYPALQFVLWGGKAPSEAVIAAMVDTWGEA